MPPELPENHTLAFELNCPLCDEPSLRQRRVRVFPSTAVGVQSGCAVMEQCSGSALILRDADLIHARPVKGTPVVTVVYRCSACEAEGLELHLYAHGGTSWMAWDAPDRG